MVNRCFHLIFNLLSISEQIVFMHQFDLKNIAVNAVTPAGAKTRILDQYVKRTCG